MNPFHIDIWLDERISALQVQPSSCSVVQKQRSSGRMRTIENKCRIKLNTNKIRILLKHSKYLFCVKEKTNKTRDPHFCLVSQIIRIMRIYHETKICLFLHEVWWNNIGIYDEVLRCIQRDFCADKFLFLMNIPESWYWISFHLSPVTNDVK